MNALPSQILTAPSDPWNPDPQETAEWLDAFDGLLRVGGPQRARQMLSLLADAARSHGVAWAPEPSTPYVNTVGVDDQATFPGDLAIEERLASLMRWNALDGTHHSTAWLSDQELAEGMAPRVRERS